MKSPTSICIFHCYPCHIRSHLPIFLLSVRVFDRAAPPRCFATRPEKAAGAVGDLRCFPEPYGDWGILWELDKLWETHNHHKMKMGTFFRQIWI